MGTAPTEAPAGRRAMRRPAAFAALCILAVVVVAAAAVQGTAQFTGPRWNPEFAPPSLLPKPFASGRAPSPTPAVTTPKPHNTLVIDPGLVLAVVIVIVALIGGALLWRWLRRRPTRFTSTVPVVESVLPDSRAAVDDEPDSEEIAPVVRRGLARAIEILDEDRPPSDAIVAAWLGLQEAAEDSGVRRRPAETPAEFTTRIIRRAGADRQSATTLLRLYQDVRFGAAEVTPTDIQRARTALVELSAAWHPSAGSNAGSGAGTTAGGGAR